MEAVARELVGPDVLPNITSFYRLHDHAPYQVLYLMLGVGDVIASMQQPSELRVVMLA